MEKRGVKKDDGQSIWFVVIWSIWIARNYAIFKGIRTGFEEIMDSVKVLSWEWVRTRRNAFTYSISSLVYRPCDLFVLLLAFNAAMLVQGVPW